MIRRFVCAVALCAVSLSVAAEPLPPGLSGNWRVTRVLSSSEQACWDAGEARKLVGTTITYRSNSMRWQHNSVALDGVLTRTVTPAQFRKENQAFGAAPQFAALGIHTQRITEVDFQHEDSDVTGATTELPGDAVLVISPTRIVISACGVFYEANRTGSTSLAIRASR